MKFPRFLTLPALVASLLALASGVVSAQPAFNATIQTESGALVLHWPSQIGQRYRIESSPDLTNWTTLPGSLAGTGGELTSTVRPAGVTDPARQFWRVSATTNTGIDAPLSTNVLQNTPASVVPQVGVTYHWTITGGDFTESDGAPNIHFVASTTGTVTLTCTLTDSNQVVVATYTAQVAVIDAPLPPTIVAPGFVTTGQTGLVASVDNRAGTVFAWTISGGTITAGAGTSAVTFTAGAVGTLTLNCTATRNSRSTAAPAALVVVQPSTAPIWETPLSETSLPPLQVNLASGGDRQWAFANMLRAGEAWIYAPGAEAAEAQTLASTLQVDAAGWPLSLPTGTRMQLMSGYRTGEDTFLHGVFVLTWEGSGAVELQSSRNDGLDEVVLLNDQAHGRFIRVIKDPTKAAPIVFVASSDSANPVRNMRLWAPAYDGAGLDLTPASDLAPGHIAGSLEPLPGAAEPMWHPRFLQHLAEAQNYGVLRFMGWQQINMNNWDRDVLEWSDRGDPSYSFGSLSTIDRSYNRYAVASYRQRLGQPFEWMIDLCNATGKDLWIQVPHIASADLIRKLADLCATRLNSNLRVWFEYSNEIWNGFGPYIPQLNAARLAAAIHFGVPFADVTGAQDAWGSGHLQGLALKTFEDEWHALGQPDHRLINVVASFVGSSGYSQGALDAAREIDPHLPEILAVTNYFGYGTQGDIFAAHTFGANPGVWPESLFAKTKEIVRRNLYSTTASWAASADVARAAGVPLVAYEGGQHMLPMGYGDWNNPVHVDFMQFMYAFQRSQKIKELYLEHYALWSAMGGRTPSLFVDTSGMSFWGYWGAKEIINQTRAQAPKWDAFVEWGDLQAGVRAPSEPIGTRPVLPTLNLRGEAQAALDQAITATGGEGTVHLLLVGGELPPGLTLTETTSGTARLAGTPTTDGVYRFVLRALDIDKDPDFKAYTMTVDPAGVTANALVTFRGQDIPATIPNNGWIARYNPTRADTVVTNTANEVVRRYVPFSLADSSALFREEGLEVAGTPNVLPATSPLTMYGGWSLTAMPYPSGATPKARAISNFTGLRDHQWCNWSGDANGGPTDFDTLLLWRADQFNAMGGSGSYSFGDDSATALLRVDLTALNEYGDNELRFVVLDGGTYYLSEAAHTSPYLGDGYFQLAGFNASSTEGHRWAVFAPAADSFAIPASATLTFTAHTFTNVQAVGLAYHGHRDGWHYSFNFSRFLALGRRN
jgi:hypothetical protein